MNAVHLHTSDSSGINTACRLPDCGGNDDSILSPSGEWCAVLLGGCKTTQNTDNVKSLKYIIILVNNVLYTVTQKLSIPPPTLELRCYRGGVE